MKKVLVAVDSTKNSEAMMDLLQDVVGNGKEVLLLHVEQLEGNSLMTSMLGEAEMNTLKDSLKGTVHKEKLDLKAQKIVSFFRKKLETAGIRNVRTLVREGNPSEEILRAADEENVDMIVVGCSGKSRLQRYMTGCVAREIEKNAKVTVLISKGNGCGKHAELWTGREAYVV
jgi:nucleotide-binding universal stress UspA family protein